MAHACPYEDAGLCCIAGIDCFGIFRSRSRIVACKLVAQPQDAMVVSGIILNHRVISFLQFGHGILRHCKLVIIPAYIFSQRPGSVQHPFHLQSLFKRHPVILGLAIEEREYCPP